MSEADDFLKKFNEADTPDPELDNPVDQKWVVSYKTTEGGKSVSKKLVIAAPNASSAETTVKRTAKVDSITSTKKCDVPEEACDGMTNDLYGFDWGK